MLAGAPRACGLRGFCLHALPYVGGHHTALTLVVHIQSSASAASTAAAGERLAQYLAQRRRHARAICASGWLGRLAVDFQRGACGSLFYLAAEFFRSGLGASYVDIGADSRCSRRPHACELLPDDICYTGNSKLVVECLGTCQPPARYRARRVLQHVAFVALGHLEHISYCDFCFRE